MSKGLIICGYPGVGKTAVGGWINCIDLESSSFDHIYFSWVETYVRVATDLATQGYTVLMSTHLEVIKKLKEAKEYADGKWDVVIFCPKKEMKDAWLARVTDRYLADKSFKNQRALMRVRERFDSDIDDLQKTGLMCFSPSNMNYNFVDDISKIRKFLKIKSVSDKPWESYESKN